MQFGTNLDEENCGDNGGLVLRVATAGCHFESNTISKPEGETLMINFLAWIVVGGVAGWLASMVVGRNDQMGCIANIAAGVVGAFVGGWLMSFVGGVSFTGFNLTSLLVAFVGAVVVLALLNLVLGRR
jgi:uncharacterized membrane protein YeaQ/YmgE (transglycosylase-associated protein family)